eukprot:TRINITY_DN81074_c0_g1_i1.p1 TRINITY_DN81074_c0_g1~~TRINITY_DN81074_c0_g1_i1.p1  ORF type:complete len:326 (-),score=34.57 TRINITY_DN81074_c0_g1_i1:260-1237(-)
MGSMQCCKRKERAASEPVEPINPANDDTVIMLNPELEDTTQFMDVMGPGMVSSPGTVSEPHVPSHRVSLRSELGQAKLSTIQSLLSIQIGRPKRFILVRHGESQANVDREITKTVPDNALKLTDKGRQQALACGEMLKEVIGEESVKFIVSPYTRTRETLNGIALAFGGIDKCTWIEEPRMREMDHGNFDKPDIAACHKEKKQFGSFFYRFPEGESPSDVYDRASSVLETLFRMWMVPKEDNYIIVAHGVFNLVFLMRFFQLKVDEYYSLAPLKNCECVILEKNEHNWYQGVTSVVAGGEKHKGLRRLDAPPFQRHIWNPGENLQ